MLAIGPPPVAPVFCRNRCRGSPSTVCWMLPNVFRKQVLPLMTVVSCRSEAAPRTSVNCDTVLNSNLGFSCQRGAHWLQSQRRNRSEVWKQRHCVHPPTVHYSDGNNEHITANTSSISRAQCNRWETRAIRESIPQDWTYSIEDTSVQLHFEKF